MERMRQLREAKGLSQAQAAVRAGMDPSTWNRLEQGKGNPNLKTLERVAEALDVQVADLFPLAQPRLPEGLSYEDILERAGAETRWALLSDEEWFALVESADAEEAMRLYEEVKAERLATFDLRQQIWREGSQAERLLVAKMWERYFARSVDAAEAAGNELELKSAFEEARRERVGSAA